MFGTHDTWTLTAETLPKLFEKIKAEDTSNDGYFYTTINSLKIIRPQREGEFWEAIITAVVF